MNLATLDAAIAANLQHGAMAGADPLTDSLFVQLEAPAAEGALPQLPYAAALAEAEREPWLGWAMVAGAAVAAAASAVWPMGFAGWPT